MSKKKKPKKQRARRCATPGCERITLQELCDLCRRAKQLGLH